MYSVIYFSVSKLSKERQVVTFLPRVGEEIAKQCNSLRQSVDMCKTGYEIYESPRR